jgi:hypothetical protein
MNNFCIQKLYIGTVSVVHDSLSLCRCDPQIQYICLRYVNLCFSLCYEPIFTFIVDAIEGNSAQIEVVSPVVKYKHSGMLENKEYE